MTTPTEDKDPASATNNPAEMLASNIKHMEQLLTQISENYKLPDADPFNLAEASAAWMKAVSTNPEKLVQAGMQYWQDAFNLYHQSALTLMGAGGEQVISEENGDRRFRHEAWQDQPVFNLIKQSYLLTSRWMRDITQDVEGLDRQSAEKIAFFTERYVDSLWKPARLQK